MAQYIGDDGKEYNTFREMMGANEKYRNLKEQTRLLDEQNKLIQEQNYNMQKEAEMNRQLQQEKMLHDAVIAEEQMEHDKEMRILGLFDSVGLNKKFYDEFVSYLFSDNVLELVEVNEKNNTKINELDNNINLINDYLNKKVDFDKISKFVYNEEDKDTLIKTKKILEDYLKNHNNSYRDIIISKFNFDDNEEFSELNEKVQKYTRIGNKYAIGTVISLFAGFIFSSSNFIGTIAIISTFVCAIIALYNYFSSGFKKMSEMMDSLVKDKLKDIEEQINDYQDNDFIDNKLKKQIDNFNEEINNLKLDNRKNQSKLKDIKTKWSEFVKFRKNHYNSKMESLFIDAGLEKQINSLGLDYCRINNDNKRKNGTVEEYITYFNNFK